MITTGECFCGDIQYAIEGPLPPGRSCHCSRCRKAFNGAGSAVIFPEPQAFRWIKGQSGLTFYRNKQGFGLGFCARCGSTLCMVHHDTVIGVTLGTLNGDPEVHIQEHIFVGSKAAWDQIGGDAVQHEAFPPKGDILRDQ